MSVTYEEYEAAIHELRRELRDLLGTYVTSGVV